MSAKFQGSYILVCIDVIIKALLFLLQINGSPVVCDLENFCVTYNPNSESWDELHSLPSDVTVHDAIAVQMDEQTAWITHSSDTTLIYTADGITNGPVLPVSTDGDQCLAKLDDDHYIMFYYNTFICTLGQPRHGASGPRSLGSNGLPVVE